MTSKHRNIHKRPSDGKAAVGISELLAMGTVEHGEKVFKRCSACHMIAAGGKNMIGPNLWSILGKQTGVASGYKYSKAESTATVPVFLRKP